MSQPSIHIIGAGLAGSEAALVASRNGIRVRLFEMRPCKTTPVHESDKCAEIVCSNSLGSVKPTTASGCVKRELATLGSPLIDIALRNCVPAGHALAVDRIKFADEVTERIKSDPNIELIRGEVESIDTHSPIPTLLATGPLTSDTLLKNIAQILGEENLYFFDAISPSVSHKSIDFDKAYYASRYDPSSDDYLNCPFTKDEYETFHKALIEAERVEIKDFEPDKLFQGCLPVEIIAQHGEETLRFSALKPVGLENPRTGHLPWAVVQLRREQADTESWNLVGFQTRLKYHEQKRVFSMIPGLEHAEFTRYGSMHRNAYIKSPYLLEPSLQLSEFPNIFVAGCLAGVEGYVEDIATGHLTGLAMLAMAQGRDVPAPPEVTMLRCLCRAITNPKNIPFQPLAASLGILPPSEKKFHGKKDRRAAIVARSLDSMLGFAEALKAQGYQIPDAGHLPE